MTLTAPHTMTRLSIPTGIGFDEFRRRFEQAAPLFDAAATVRITERGGTWDDVRAAIAAQAPNGLLIFHTIDATPLMAAAGHRTKVVEYLLGNHVTAEKMFRHDHTALLYAPLRILISGDDSDMAVFTIDQPSTVFGGIGIQEVAEVGVRLDRDVAGLLQEIGVEPPSELTDSVASSSS
ncbi:MULTISPECIES: hypothetical protein [unclassified Streptomyces]|uniref:hypothetical protein n=1 Tax=unclassified Streptomyces TaxID=2593676 RepID=UPI0008F1BAD6|nr:hypothetical protein [Streptomyces sp. ok210]SFT06671.1 hypothetical protein SAMN04487982_106255 [Streptomyces sp. ok210]